MGNDIIKQNEAEGAISILDADHFPSKTRPIEFTPQQLQDMLVAYSKYRGSIVKCCEQYSIDIHTFYGLCRTYPEIKQLYSTAQEERAELMADETLDIADSGDDDILMNVSKNGNEVFAPNMAAVRRDELRIKARQYLMGKYNNDKYGDKTKVEQSVRSVNIHAHTLLPDPGSIEDIGLDGLMNIQRDMRYGQGTSQQAGATRR